MFNQLSSLMKASLYYVIAFGLAVLVAAVLISMPELGERLGPIDLYMLTPMAAVLLMLLVVTRDGKSKAGWKVLGLHRLGLRSWGMALLAPFFLFSCTYAIAWTMGIGRLDLSRLPGVSEILFFLIEATILGLMEEIGWRGYLLPHLVSLGRTRALLVSGLLHGVWHLPVILMTSTYHESGDRLIVVSLFLLSLTAAGVLYGYLRLTSDSVWPAALAHGSINTSMALFAMATVAVSSPELLEYWAGESGVLSLLGITLLAGWLILRLNRKPNGVQTAVALDSQPLSN